jgi:RNA polymerase sigma factor (sigma-70 family)
VDQEANYIRQIVAGDTALYAWFVTVYKHGAFALAYRMLENEQDAEEVVQDAFLKAYKALGGFRGDAKYSTWLYRIVVNESLVRLKKKKRQGRYAELEIAEEQLESVETGYRGLTATDQTRYINLALGRLNPEDRLLLALYYLEEQPLAEIAVITGIGRDNLKMRLHRARKKMYGVLSGMLNTELNTIRNDE